MPNPSGRFTSVWPSDSVNSRRLGNFCQPKIWRWRAMSTSTFEWHMNSDDLGSRESASTIAASYPTTHTISCVVVSVSVTSITRYGPFIEAHVVSIVNASEYTTRDSTAGFADAFAQAASPASAAASRNRLIGSVGAPDSAYRIFDPDPPVDLDNLTRRPRALPPGRFTGILPRAAIRDPSSPSQPMPR